MGLFIQSHIFVGYILLVLSGLAAFQVKLNMGRLRLWLVRLFFVLLWIMGLEGIVIGTYRHGLVPSVFQIVTLVGLLFATVGLLALAGKLEGFRGKSRHYWYINGLGGSLIATFSASLFFIALQFFPDFYRANIVWFTIIFIAVPFVVGQLFIARFSNKG